MATQRLTFGEWLPDQPAISGALSEAKNVISQSIGYGPLPLPVEVASSVGETLYTMHTAQTPTNQSLLYVAGRANVYKVSAIGTVTNVSGGSYATPSGDRIRFTQFGQSTLFTNNADKVQSLSVTSGGNFADVDAGAPVAKYITVVRDFVVVANTFESGARYPTRIRWSGINDETEWAFSQTTQADYQDIPDGGNVVGIRGGEFGLILMDNAIYRMSYVGTPFIFQFDNISRGTGCREENSIAQYQGITFFLSDDGFYMCDGQTVKPIGSEKVDRHFFNVAQVNNLSSMSAAVDPIRKLVIWNFSNINGGRSLLIYNFKTARWTNADGIVDYVSDASTGGVTLEDLDNISTSIDALGQSLDSSAFIGGQHFLGGVKDQSVYSFTGLPRDAEIITGDIGASNSVVTLARPQIDNGSATVSVASRARLDQPLTYSTPVAATSENRVALRSAGKYHRIKVNPTGDNWLNAVAVDVDIAPQGGR